MSEKVFFKHFRPVINGKIDNRGGMTVAYTPRDGGGVKFAFACCHPGDNFNKRIGRVKSSGRLNSKIEALQFDGNLEEFDKYMELFTLNK